MKCRGDLCLTEKLIQSGKYIISISLKMVFLDERAILSNLGITEKMFACVCDRCSNKRLRSIVYLFFGTKSKLSLLMDKIVVTVPK